MSTPRTTRTRPTPRDVAPREVEPRRPAHTEPDEPAEEFDDDIPDEEAGPEVAQDMEANGHYVTAELCDEPVRIIPPGAWRQSWQRHLQAGRFDAFAECVIHPNDVDLYFELDPTNDEFGEFVGEAASMSGESLGKSRGPAASSRRGRKR